MSFYASYPVMGGSGGVPTYTNLAAFPSAVGAGNGALAIALDTDILYISNGTIWEVLADPAISPLAITALTGDGTATGPGSVPLTLATVNSNVGSFGTASSVGTITLNAKGLTTAASNTAIQIAESQVTNLVTDLAGKQSTTLTNTHLLVGNVSNVATDVAASGDLTLANTGAFTFNTVNGNVGSFGSASSVGTFTVNAKGLTTAAGSTSIQIAESQVTNLVTDLAAKQSTTLTNAHILVGNVSNVATDVAVSGDITITNAGVTAIGTNKVTNAQLAQMAAHTFKGNNTGGTANALDLTATQATAELNIMTGDSGSGGLKGLVPAQATGDATKFLTGAGTWVSVAGDVTGPASAVNNNAVLFDGTSGKLIKDSGLPYTNIYVQNTAATANLRASEGSGTTTLTIADNPRQIFNLSADRTVKLPTTSVKAGEVYTITNRTNFVLTIQASDASALAKSYATRIEVAALIDTPVASTDWIILGVVVLNTNWISFTPTGSWLTNIVYTGQYRRVADSLEVLASLKLSGATTNVAMTINIPNSWTIDNSKLTTVITSDGIGTNIFGMGNVNSSIVLRVAYSSTTDIVLRYEHDNGTQVNIQGSLTSSAPAGLGNGDGLACRFTVPITQFADY